MKFLEKLAREEIRTLKPCVHGGEVLEAAKQHNKNQAEILDFSANVNPLGPPPKALAAIKANFRQIPFYPELTSVSLKAAIARHVGVDIGNVIVGNGSTELIWLFAGVFIKKGDEALIPVPTFGEYETAVRKAGGKPKFVNLTQSDLSVNADDILKRMKAQTKAIFLCNPNNPTGKIIAKEELFKIVQEATCRNILVFVDEDFMDFVDEGKRFTLMNRISSNRNIFILRSFTKSFGLAGVRIGYGIGCKEMIELLHRAKIPWNVNCLAQVAAISALADSEYIDKTRRLIARERAYLRKKLSMINDLKVFLTDANFVLIDIRSTGLKAAQLKEKMLEHGILIRDCSSFVGLDEYFVRVAVRTRKENERLLDALRSVLGA